MDREEEAPDLSPVTVRCRDCERTWQEFRQTACLLFHDEGQGFVATQESCVFCNPTPGQSWRQGTYL